EWSPEASRSISRKERGGISEENVVTLTNIVSSGGGDAPPSPITVDTGSVILKYHFEVGDGAVKSILLLFNISRCDELLKLGEEDEQGWCKGQVRSGQVGLYPANYVQVITS
ncbi:hypothetical protein XENOCAPTIV_020575, partial [Xenoophorus captivus]